MWIMPNGWRVALRSCHGAALPFALLALLILSLLATALLLSSSTEQILSRAHREATEELYAAEGAVHAWIADRDHLLAATTLEPWTAPGSSVPMRITVERLAGPGGLGSEDRNSLFAIHAEPVGGAGGGRGIGALIRARQWQFADFYGNIDAAVVASDNSAASATVAGMLVVRDGTAHPLCPVAHGPAASAWLLAQNRGVTLTGGAQLEGAINTTALQRDALLQSVLGNVGVRDLAWNAAIRFGRYFNEPPFPQGELVHSGQADPLLRWGCPADVLDGLRASAFPSAMPPPCPATADTSTYVIVAIDAENRALVLDGHHAQGILIVVNGSLHLRDRFVFKGLILAERDVRISGGGAGWPPSIEGAVIAGGGVVIQGGAGERSLRFNRCAVERAQAEFNGPVPNAWGARRLIGKAHGWFEVTQ